MKSKNRREFLTDLGLTVGGIALGKNLVEAFPLYQIPPKKGVSVASPPPSPQVQEFVNFRYAPRFWQSTYCFPDDSYKSLVGKNGELLCNHPGIGGDEKTFPQIVSIVLKDQGEGKFLSQSLEAPGIPIITTEIGYKDFTAKLISFASDNKDEGRVDNLIAEIRPNGSSDLECTPQIVVVSKSLFWAKEKEDKGRLHFENEAGKLFLLTNSSLKADSTTSPYSYELESGTAKKDKPLRFVVRLPQAGQTSDQIKGNVDDAEHRMEETRMFWKSWKPTSGKVLWELPGEYGNFYAASIRNMVESREIKEGKKLFQVGPSVYRGLWFIDGTFLLEAARYAGYDKEAQEGLESIWNRQQLDGSFKGGGGDALWKDTAAAIYSLVRQGELSQDWSYFRELYPDAVKAMGYLIGLCVKASTDGTSNGKYNLLPRGFGDSGIGGIRAELTNTLWTLMALKPLLETADRFALQRRTEIREFYTNLRQAFFAAIKEEQRQHPGGFAYLPMLMKDDPQWAEKDIRKQPRPQVAQIYLSQAIYPGLIFTKDFWAVNGHIELMKAVTKEEIPIETGWLTNEAVWTYNAPIVAQVYLWVGLQELARKTFIGFLNHASPLYAWREEQSLLGSTMNEFIGDMPHNWASAECVRYLRHMMIMEDGDRLRLLDGIGIEDLIPRKGMSLTYSPTKWGRVTLNFEPLDTKAWSVKFRREDFDTLAPPELTYVEMPRHLPGNFQFDKMEGAPKPIKNGPRVMIDPTALAWQATYRNFERK